MVSFLRAEITRITEDKRRLEDRCEKLTDKLVLFSEKASEQEHRFKMTQLAHMKPAPMEGMLPRDDLTMDDNDRMIDELFDQISKVK
jgi:hypothetical protein